MTPEKLKNILEALLLSADRPLTVVQLDNLFEIDEDRPTRDEVRKALHEIEEECSDRGFELKQVATGYRMQVKQDFAPWVGRLWEEKPARYTRALLETMALIAYRQPVTRGEIEDVRGVSVSSNIVRTLMERDWIKVLGHKDVPGKPSLYGTTREFLDYFNLKSLDELPSLAELKDLDKVYPELELEEGFTDEDADKPSATDDAANEDQSEEIVAEQQQAEQDLTDTDTNESKMNDQDAELDDVAESEQAIDEDANEDDDVSKEPTAASM